MEFILLVIFPAMMAYAAVSDLLTMTIPNRISLLLVGGFILAALALGLPVKLILAHLGAGGLMFAITFGLFAAGIIGGGDAKLAAATSLWCGLGQLMDYLLVASLAGGVLTLVLLQLRRLPLPDSLARFAWITRLHDRSCGIPYGIALGIGGLVVFPSMSLVRLALA